MSDVIQDLEGCPIDGDVRLVGIVSGAQGIPDEVAPTSQFQTGGVTVRELAVLLVEFSRCFTSV